MNVKELYNQNLDSFVYNVLADKLSNNYDNFLRTSVGLAYIFDMDIEKIVSFSVPKHHYFYFENIDNLFLLYTIENKISPKVANKVILGILRFAEDFNLEIAGIRQVSGYTSIRFIIKELANK